MAVQIKNMGVLIIAVLMMLALPVKADEVDQKLSQLFEALTSAESAEESSQIISQIWTLWSNDTQNAGNLKLMKRGMIFMESGNLSIAEHIFTRILEREPEYMEVWNKRATVRYMMRNLAGSEADIYEVLSREPRHFGALSGLGLIRLANRDYAGALEVYQEVLLINPFSPDAHRFIAELHQLLNGEPT